MNEFDAAKKMNLGTITGKYQQKALALKSLTVSEFEIVMQEFLQVLKGSKIQKDVSDNSFR